MRFTNFETFSLRGILHLVLLLSLSQSAVAGETSESSRIERIGGNFKIERISKLPKGGFEVRFRSAEGNPKISSLRLESDHINANLIEGNVIRLSADVVSTAGSEAEVTQVVVFMPTVQGTTPVWMISRGARHFAPPAKLIEMHAPSTDYVVF